MLNVFTFLQWCFNRLIPAHSSQFGTFCKPFCVNPHHGFISQLFLLESLKVSCLKSKCDCRDTSVSEWLVIQPLGIVDERHQATRRWFAQIKG